MPRFSISPNLGLSIASTCIHTHTHTHTHIHTCARAYNVTSELSYREHPRYPDHSDRESLISREGPYPALLPHTPGPLSPFSSFSSERNAARKDRGRTARRPRAALEGGKRKEEPRTVSYVDRGPCTDGHVNRLRGPGRRATYGRRALRNPRKRVRGERPVHR